MVDTSNCTQQNIMGLENQLKSKRDYERIIEGNKPMGNKKPRGTLGKRGLFVIQQSDGEKRKKEKRKTQTQSGGRIVERRVLRDDDAHGRCSAVECRDGHSQQAGGCRRALPPNQGEEPYRAGPKRSSLVCRLKVDSRFVRRML